jgi:hypothetical protein
MIDDYWSIKEVAEKWGISRRRVNAMIKAGQIPNAIYHGGMWFIPKRTRKPVDGRTIPHSRKSSVSPKTMTWCDGCTRHGKCSLEPYGASICDE